MKNQKQRPEVMKVSKTRKSTRGMAAKALLISAALSASCCMSVFAGQWMQDANGWVYQNDDGSFQKNGWFTDVDGKMYFFNEFGYMLSNTTTPDGQRVDADGVYMQPVMSLPSNKGDVYYRGLRRVVDSIPLYPQETTGHPELDALLDQIFAQIITPDMDTHDKLKACYDYLIVHTDYAQNSAFGGSYNMAYALLTEGVGVCDDYSAAFAVMARKIGVPVYTAMGSTHRSGGGFTGHAWCQLDWGGVTYIFDPQVDDNIAKSRGGAIMYIRFGGTTAQLADKYIFSKVYDDFSAPVKKTSSQTESSGNDSWNGNTDGMTDDEFMDWIWDMLMG